ncbi:MAG: hypothetical protein M3416_18395 [Acidobacteriota bacterium]|nr:hypothetical protein [Acidobacteriota bacterium]
MPTLKLQIRASHFVMPKEGAGLDECEDAVGLDVEGGRFAVADGATEAFDAGSWARALAEGWVGMEAAPLTVEEFKAWVAEEGKRLQESWSGRRLPWYAEEKARAGSFAAFVGLSFEGAGSGLRWRAIALGDACVVQRRGGAVRAAMPLSRAGEFNSCPALVPSHGAALEAALAHAVTAGGGAAAGDTFLLLSDAAAAWFFKLFEERAPLLEEFDSWLAASDNGALAGLFRRERDAGRIKDDDVAVVRVAVEGF